MRRGALGVLRGSFGRTYHRIATLPPRCGHPESWTDVNHNVRVVVEQPGGFNFASGALESKGYVAGFAAEELAEHWGDFPDSAPCPEIERATRDFKRARLRARATAVRARCTSHHHRSPLCGRSTLSLRRTGVSSASALHGGMVHQTGHSSRRKAVRHLPHGLGGAHPVHNLEWLRSSINQHVLLLLYAVLRVSAAALPTSSKSPLVRRRAWKLHKAARQVLRRGDRWSRRNMRLVGAVTIGARYALGDAIVQCLFGVGPVDYARMLTFLSFGVSYGAGPMYNVYTRLYPWMGKTIFAKFPSIVKTGLTLLFEFTMHIPLLYFPCFYLVSEVFKSGLTLALPLLAAQAYCANFLTDNLYSFAVWFPLHAANFWLVPLHLRIPFMSAAGLLWTVLLSFTRE